jgi:NitT/TauT family transport system substrate-binding protein
MICLRRTAAFVALAAAVGLLSASVRAQAPPALRLTGSLVDGVTPVLYAQRGGLFRQAGLNVTMERSASGSITAAAVIGGSVDIGESNVVSIITAHARGLPLIIIAPASLYNPKTPDAALLVAANSPLRSARDLVGKTIAITSISDLSTIATQAWLESEHVDWHGIRTVEVALPQMEEALETGRVDGIVLIKPFLTDALASGKARLLWPVYSAIADRFLESAWFAKQDFIDGHRELIATFQRIVAQASAYTNAHNAETADLLATWAGIDPQRAVRVPRGTVGTTLQARDIQPVIDVAARYGVISKAFSAREVIIP